MCKKYTTNQLIAEHYHVCAATISKYKKEHPELEVPSHLNPLTQEQKDYVISMYHLATSTELAKELNKTRGIITKLWFDAKLKGKDRRQYKYNFDFFKEVNTKEKAYFLGLIAADGCLYSRILESGYEQKLISLSLHAQDREILEIFKEKISLEKPIYAYTTAQGTPVVALQIVGKEPFDDLHQYGLTVRKTWTYEPVMLEDNLMSHFIRGYFDGDGSLAKGGTKDRLCDVTTSICGNLQTMTFFQQFLQTKGIEASLIEDKREKYSERFYMLIFRSIEQNYSFLHYIYQDAGNLCLSRKKDAFLSFANSVDQLKTNKPAIAQRAILSCEERRRLW